MSLAITGNTAFTSGTAAAATATTASKTYSNNTLYIFAVEGRSSSGNCALVIPVTSGLSWQQLQLTTAAVAQGGLYCACVSSGATTATTALDCGQVNGTRMTWSMIEVTGSAATGANNGTDGVVQSAVQQRTASQTTISVTLSDFADAVNNIAFGSLFVEGGPQTPVAEANYTTLSTQAATNGNNITEFILGQDTTVTATCTSQTVFGLACEIKVASSLYHGPMLTGVG